MHSACCWMHSQDLDDWHTVPQSPQLDSILRQSSSCRCLLQHIQYLVQSSFCILPSLGTCQMCIWSKKLGHCSQKHQPVSCQVVCRRVISPCSHIFKAACCRDQGQPYGSELADLPAGGAPSDRHTGSQRSVRAGRDGGAQLVGAAQPHAWAQPFPSTDGPALLNRRQGPAT